MEMIRSESTVLTRPCDKTARIYRRSRLGRRLKADPPLIVHRNHGLRLSAAVCSARWHTEGARDCMHVVHVSMTHRRDIHSMMKNQPPGGPAQELIPSRAPCANLGKLIPLSTSVCT
eukprot:gnl/TRDRNA2_/TRDRNA2_82729_c0_seq1.p1 gnl/TRDRNA2_/TRDRNA2_82729_c0~~gnl/TRDRNA2_/TRDRNA2_82729_c0_seq1.p1  ORF type:complete len:117 (-),score=0.86 gnl/TRDRNA2_/TRDRNA2_82729_c0_seq1:236-586(-)